MRCADCERWISDALAGALSGKRAEKLAAHLRGCPSCRAFEREARLVQGEAPALAPREAPLGDWQGFGDRLRTRLAGEAPPAGRENAGRSAWSWKWAFAAAPLLLTAAAGLFLLLRPSLRREAHFYLPPEERLSRITFELEDSPELQSAFNLLLDSSLGEDLAGAVTGSGGLDNPLLFQEVTDEEMVFVLEELKKELKS
ncbi:MAG: zf-HC2 domain-containing protein [Candidatus Aminicenantes bacterium]|nr:zf-HC2 domain-containing protein [Candidatus Aminicenantes bacterium]